MKPVGDRVGDEEHGREADRHEREEDDRADDRMKESTASAREVKVRTPRRGHARRLGASFSGAGRHTSDRLPRRQRGRLALSRRARGRAFRVEPRR